MKKLVISLALTASLLGAERAGGQDRPTIRIATEGAFPPWNAVDTSGQPIGFDIDVGKALCQRAALKCEFVTQAWDGIIPALTVGKYDAIMAGMSITEKRKQVIAFSTPYALTSNYFVVARSFAGDPMEEGRKIDLSANTAEDKAMLDILKSNLEGKIIGVQGSTNAEAFVREFFGDTVEIRTYETQDNLNLDLVAGRIDAGLADYSVWKAFLDSSEGAQATLYGPRISGGLFGPGVGVGFRKQDQDLVQTFNEAIGAIAADGTLKEISAKWFGADLVPD